MKTSSNFLPLGGFWMITWQPEYDVKILPNRTLQRPKQKITSTAKAKLHKVSRDNYEPIMLQWTKREYTNANKCGNFQYMRTRGYYFAENYTSVLLITANEICELQTRTLIVSYTPPMQSGWMTGRHRWNQPFVTAEQIVIKMAPVFKALSLPLLNYYQQRHHLN